MAYKPGFCVNIEQNVKIKWGVDHPFQLKSVQEKSMATSLQKWGTPHFVQSAHYKERLFEMGFSDKLRYIYLNKHIEKYRNLDLDFIKIDGRILDIYSKACGHTFSIHYDSLKRRIENDYEYCTYLRCHLFNRFAHSTSSQLTFGIV